MVGITAPFMVIDTDIFSRGMPLNRVFMSSTESMATPAMPTSPCTRGLSESYLGIVTATFENNYNMEKWDKSVASGYCMECVSTSGNRGIVHVDTTLLTNI